LGLYYLQVHPHGERQGLVNDFDPTQLERHDGTDPAQCSYISVLVCLLGRKFHIPRLSSIQMLNRNRNQIVEDAEAEFLTFFATKTIGLIRAPDEFVYPAPFNLVELFIAPFE
jgi:hypothetical protein